MLRKFTPHVCFLLTDILVPGFSLINLYRDAVLALLCWTSRTQGLQHVELTYHLLTVRKLDFLRRYSSFYIYVFRFAAILNFTQSALHQIYIDRLFHL